MREQIEIAAKMYKCQTTAKNLFKEEYNFKIKPYENIIEAHRNRFGLDVLPSVLELSSFESVRDNGMAIMLFMAAAVEIIERKKETV